MKISIIGASAGIGLEAVKRGLDRQHEITTLSRTPVNIDNPDAINMILGDALNKEDLAKSIKDADAILVCLGTGRSMKPTTLFSDFAKGITQIHKEKPIDVPFIFVTGFGAGESKNYTTAFVKLFMRFFLREVYEDKSKMEEIITATDIPWTVVRPGRLLDRELSENYRIENKLYKGIKAANISRADVADLMIKQAENHSEKHKFLSTS